MKAITLTQPWATLVAIGAKRIETRSWSTSYRGPIAIHAAKGFPRWARELARSKEFLNAPQVTALLADGFEYPRGVVIATCNLVRCVETDLIERYVQPFTEQERSFGDYSPRRFGFLLEGVEVLSEPIPATGALGLWEWSPPQSVQMEHVA